MRVLALVPYPCERVPNQRFRIEQWVPHLKAAGITVEFLPFETLDFYNLMAQRGRTAAKAMGLLSAMIARCFAVRRVRDFDAVFLHREAVLVGPALLERWIGRRRPLVYDFDDAIWMSNENRVNPIAPWFKFPGKTATIVRLSAAILAGNDYLARWARQFNPRAYTVPTTIDVDHYAPLKVHTAAARPVIGWSGSQTTLRYLEVLLPVLRDLARRRSYTLRVICNGAPQTWSDVPMEWCSWNAAREVADLLAFDVGLMPQPDEEWANGKCGLKALQYMGLGIPPVASRNGVLPDIITDGKSGELAATPAEWLERLERLLDDPVRRAEIGARARETVETRYSAHVQAPRVAAIFREVVAT